MKALAVVADSIERRKIEELFGRRQLGVRLESDAHAARTAVEDLGASYLLVDLDAAGDPLDLLRHARAGAQPPWAVVLTRQETPSALRAALEAGADDYLMLPIEPRRLQLKLALGERALAARQQRRDAERGCRQAEQRYRTLVETMSEGLFEIDTEGRIRDANAQLGRITGYPMDELIGAHADRLLVDETMLTRLPGGTLLGGVGAEEYSLPLRTKHGEDRWVKLVGSPLAGAESGRLGSIGVVQDITEQRDAEESLRRREEYFRALLENASDLVTIVDREGGILYLSRSSRRILGREAEQLFGSNIVDLVHPDDRTTFRQRLTPPAEAPDQTAGIEVRFAHRDGSWCYLESVFTDLIDNPVLGGIVVTSRPIADRRKIEEALKRQRAFFEQLFQKSPAGIVILDTSGRVVDANAAFVDLFQHEIAQLAGDRLSQIIVPEDLQQETVELEQLVQQGQSVARETRRQRRDGTSVDVSILAFPIALSGRRIGTYAIYTDITERKNAERQLFHDAFHDALTGLPNRTLLSERLERALRRAKRRQDYRFALLFTDLDGFKQINDAHGHAVGDAFLVEVARRLESCLRPGDTTARLGGDEFMLLLEDIKDPSDATRVAERILFSLDQPFAIEGHELRGSGSIGIAFSSPSIRDVDALVRDADMAMYRAKQRGKACYELYDTEMHESAVESRQLESELRRALSEEQLALHYQPILSTATGRLWGFEALARWNHPQRGLLDASAWLASVRAAGLSARLDTWVLATAIAHLARWRDRFPERADAMLSLNLTGESVLRTETSETILRLCEEHGVHPATVIVEIAESDLVEIGEPAVDALWQLHNRGVRLWIDDFGLGALPIARLHRLPVDALKVDARLIEAINPGEDALEVVRAVEVLGRSFGMTTIAEGIETAEQVREIRRLSIARAQGFYLAAPVPADEADQILERGLDLPMAELTTSD